MNEAVGWGLEYLPAQRIVLVCPSRLVPLGVLPLCVRLGGCLLEPETFRICHFL